MLYEMVGREEDGSEEMEDGDGRGGEEKEGVGKSEKRKEWEKVVRGEVDRAVGDLKGGEGGLA